METNNKLTMSEYHKAYYQTHREKLLAYSKEYEATHPRNRQQSYKHYDEEHKEQRKEARRLRYLLNRDSIIAARKDKRALQPPKPVKVVMPAKSKPVKIVRVKRTKEEIYTYRLEYQRKYYAANRVKILTRTRDKAAQGKPIETMQERNKLATPTQPQKAKVANVAPAMVDLETKAKRLQRIKEVWEKITGRDLE